MQVQACVKDGEFSPHTTNLFTTYLYSRRPWNTTLGSGHTRTPSVSPDLKMEMGMELEDCSCGDDLGLRLLAKSKRRLCPPSWCNDVPRDMEAWEGGEGFRNFGFVSGISGILDKKGMSLTVSHISHTVTGRSIVTRDAFFATS